MRRSRDDGHSPIPGSPQRRQVAQGVRFHARIANCVDTTNGDKELWVRGSSRVTAGLEGPQKL